MSQDWKTLRDWLRRCFPAAEAMEHFQGQIDHARELGDASNMKPPLEYGPGY